mgnify:CR=1 FL=1
MEWMVDYAQLDDDQKDFVDSEINKDGNIWIKGFAGSGKSVMLIHALRKKLQESPKSKVCVVVFTHSLIDMFCTGMSQIGLKYRKILNVRDYNEKQNDEIPIMTYLQFKKINDNFDYIFCDEVQDLTEGVLQKMRNKSKHVHVAGDSNQSIYDDTVNTNEIGDIINARSFVLTRIYRLTRSIMNAVSNLMPNMDIFGSRRDMTKKDVDIRICQAYDKEEEVKYVFDQGTDAASEGYSAVVLLPLKEKIIEFSNIILRLNKKNEWEKTYDRYGNPDWSNLNKHFKTNNINVEYVGNRHGSFENASKNNNLIIMTYHSAKGMDFDNVFLPFLSDDLYIPGDEKTLFMVAMTRSRTNLFITYSGYLHHLVEKFESSCQKISINQVNNTTQESLDFDF